MDYIFKRGVVSSAPLAMNLENSHLFQNGRKEQMGWWRFFCGTGRRSTLASVSGCDRMAGHGRGPSFQGVLPCRKLLLCKARSESGVYCVTSIKLSFSSFVGIKSAATWRANRKNIEAEQGYLYGGCYMYSSILDI